jgi:hypothetical protein
LKCKHYEYVTIDWCTLLYLQVGFVIDERLTAKKNKHKVIQFVYYILKQVIFLSAV